MEIGRLHPIGMFVVGDENAIPQRLVDEMTKAGVITSVAPPPPSTTVAPTTVPVTSPPDPAAVTTVPATTTTAPAATTTTLAPTPTADRPNVIRLTGATPAEIGRVVTGALDVRTDEEKRRSVPAFSGAVAVNPDSKESAKAIAFAASQRLPILFVDHDGVPAPTADAVNTMSIQNTWVVGGTGSISDTVLAQLPGAKRLGGADLASTSVAVAGEVKARALPVNVVFVADESRPVDAAVAGAAVARLGGLLVLTPEGDTATAEQRINEMGLSDQVDQIVVSESTSPSNVPWALIVVSAALAAAGVLLLALAARKRRRVGDAPAVPMAPRPEPDRRT